MFVLQQATCFFLMIRPPPRSTPFPYPALFRSAGRGRGLIRLRWAPVDPRPRWYRVGWALPWLLFQFFPAADLVTTDRPLAVRVVAGVGLVVFTAVYLDVFRRAFGGCGSGSLLGRLAVVAVLGTGLAVW